MTVSHLMLDRVPRVLRLHALDGRRAAAATAAGRGARARRRALSRAALGAAVAAPAAALTPSANAAAPTPAQLLARYQPVAVLHPDEVFRPVAVEGFLAAAELQRRGPGGAWIASGPATSLPEADPSDCVSTADAPCWRLDVPGCTPSVGVASIECYRGVEALQGVPSVVYGAVHRRRAGIALQYWHWYSYNFWSGEHPPSDYVWQAHEGDWEVVTVVLSPSGKPRLAAYSEHSCGKRRAWRDVPRWRRTQHPVVHVALGSHANAFTARPYPVDLRPQCYPPLGAALLRSFLHPPLDRVGAGVRLGPRLPGVAPARVVRVTASAPAWMRFPGRWGEANYFHVPEPVGTEVAGPAPAGLTRRAIWRDPIGTVLSWPRG